MNGSLAQSARRVKRITQNGDLAGRWLLTELAGELMLSLDADISITDLAGKSLLGHAVSGGAFSDVRSLTFPIVCNGVGLGTIDICRRERDFDEDERVLCEFVTSAISLAVCYSVRERERDAAVKEEIVKSAMSSLSYSELKAVICMIKELGGVEGRLVAGNIADKVEVARSVIVNALCKLESAGILESRSLGMKGTYIKILNEKLLDEVKAYS